jgi:hypothetical protein
VGDGKREVVGVCAAEGFCDIGIACSQGVDATDIDVAVSVDTDEFREIVEWFKTGSEKELIDFLDVQMVLITIDSIFAMSCIQRGKELLQRGELFFGQLDARVEQIAFEDDDIGIEGIDSLADFFEKIIADHVSIIKIGKTGDQKTVTVIIDLGGADGLFPDLKSPAVDADSVIPDADAEKEKYDRRCYDLPGHKSIIIHEAEKDKMSQGETITQFYTFET